MEKNRNFCGAITLICFRCIFQGKMNHAVTLIEENERFYKYSDVDIQDRTDEYQSLSFPLNVCLKPILQDYTALSSVDALYK